MMKISYIEPIRKNKKTVERVFGCSYVNYAFPNIYILIILALLEKNYKVSYNQQFLYFKHSGSLRKFLTDDKTDIYLIFSVNLSMEGDIAFAKNILDIDKGKIIIFLGPAPTFFTDRFIFDKNTYVIRGEPDLAAPDLIDALALNKEPQAVDGVSYLKNGQIVHNKARAVVEELDALPFPARHLVEPNKFFNPKLGLRPFTVMLTSRGCSHRCIYCVPCSLNFARELEFKKTHGYKPPVRLRSADNVIEEFKLLKGSGYRAISIIDDQFVWDKQRALDICSGISGLNLSWGCLSRVNHVDAGVIKAMQEAGCKYVDIGVESFAQQILDYTKKDITSGELIEGIRLFKKYKIFVKLNILFGASHYETKETVKYTLKKIKEINPDQVMFDVCSPFPGTEFYEIAKRENWLLGGDYQPIDVAHSANISYPHLPARELEKIVKSANLHFFFNAKFIIKNISRLKNLSYIIEALKALLKKLFK